MYSQFVFCQSLRDVLRVLLEDAKQHCKATSTHDNRWPKWWRCASQGSKLHKIRHIKAGEENVINDKEVCQTGRQAI